MFPLHILFYFTLILGSIIAVNSNSWFIAWVGLEVNLMSILPIMSGEKTSGSSESCVKYFLVQSMASMLILISSVYIFSSFLFNSLWVIFVGLSIKLGVAPFHVWFPIVMEGVGWMNCLLLMTWQKLAPFFLTGFVKILLFLIVITSLVGAIGGFGQFSLKKLMAYSSINHVGWMLAGMMSKVSVGMVYYLVYIFLSMLVVSIFMMFKLSFLSQISSSSFFSKMLILMGFLSLGGMPPMMGFFPSMFVIEVLLWSSLFLALVLIFASLVSLYFYMRMMYPSLFLNLLGLEKWMGVSKYMAGLVLFFFLSSGGFFFYPLLSSMEMLG